MKNIMILQPFDQKMFYTNSLFHFKAWKILIWRKKGDEKESDNENDKKNYKKYTPFLWCFSVYSKSF